MSVEAVLASPGYVLLKLALDAASLRHQVTANNIANVGTENYQPMRVSFEEHLRQEAALTQGTSIKPRVEADETQTSVSMDREMVEMTKNFIHYQSLLKALNGKYELTGLALNDGRR